MRSKRVNQITGSKMRRLAKLFSLLAIAFLFGAAWLVWQKDLPFPDGRPAAPTATTAPATTTRPGFGIETAAPELPDAGEGYAPARGAPTAALPALVSPVERILIEKGARRMTVYQKEGPAMTYRIALGRTPEGTKTRQGDGRTPEGVFKVDRLNDKSRFHLSLGLDYPQKKHREAARKAGVDPGGDIMIHDQPNEIAQGFRVKGDWTEGCIAIDDHEIEDIFAMTRIGTEVEIRP